MKNILLVELSTKYLESISQASAKTISYYLKDFIRFISNKNICDITVNDIQEYINYKRSMKLKDTTLYRYYRTLKTLFNYAISHDYLQKNPCEGVKVKHKLRAEIRDINYSKKYIKKLLKLFKTHKLYYIVLIAVHTRYA